MSGPHAIWERFPVAALAAVAEARFSDAADGWLCTINGESPLGVAINALGVGGAPDPSPDLVASILTNIAWPTSGSRAEIEAEAKAYAAEWDAGLIDRHDPLGDVGRERLRTGREGDTLRGESAPVRPPS